MTQPTLNSPSVAAGIPTLAIVGRPNVGKSTLFNRLVGSRRAIVGDEPGITRDRLYGEAEWRGRRLRIVDTGGILPEDKDFIPAEIFRQAKVALKEADAVVMVVDGRTEMAAPDIDLALQLIRTGKPLFLAVNKVDTEKQKARLGTIVRSKLGPPGEYAIAPPGSADLVVTFRNLHNWIGGGFSSEALAACYKALKPGGILGIEDHRGRNDQPQDPKAESGYLRQDYAIALVKQAGFEFVAASEINANIKDTKDWPEGVWTLPPTLALGEKDRARYQAIGEADNFVLKFRKPAR